MDGINSMHQVVFLIDVSAGVPVDDTDNKADKISSCISLSALRILTYLSTQPQGRQVPCESEVNNLKWGFKFYNTVSRRIQKPHFKEFSAKTFDEFEAEVENVIESEKAKSHGLVRERLCSSSALYEFDNSQSLDSFIASRRARHAEDDGDSVDKLQCALREIVTDFQWDRPDISSPVKSRAPRRPTFGRKRSTLSSVEENEARQQNLTFLFSRCPHSLSHLAQYAGVTEDASPQDVLSSFLPSPLYRQFYECSKIRMIWVDLDADPSNDLGCLAGLDRVHEALSKVGGGILPLNALIHFGAYTTTPIQRLLQEESCPPADDGSSRTSAVVQDGQLGCDSRPSALVLPLSGLLKWYVGDSLRAPPSYPSLTGKNARIVFSCGGQDDIMYDVSIRSLTLPRMIKSQVSQQHHSTEPCLLEITEGISTKDTSPSKRDVSLTVLPPAYQSLQQTSVELRDLPATLLSRGTVPSGVVPLETLQSEEVFTVDAVGDDAGSAQRFQRLLLALARSGNALVIECMRRDLLSPPKLALLQPLACDIATLTFVKSELLHTVEKSLVFGSRVHQESTTENVAEHDYLVSSNVRQFCKARLKCRRVFKKEIAQGPVVSEPIKDVAFGVNLLEPWMTSSVVGDVTDTLIQSLHDNELHSQIEATEVRALQAVQKLYHQAKYCRHQRRPSSASTSFTSPRKQTAPKASPRKTPRKSPRKAVRKSPRKTFQNSPRRTPRKTPQKRVKVSPKKGKVRKSSAVGSGRPRRFTAPLGRTAMIIQRSQQVAAQSTDDDDTEGKKGEVLEGKKTEGTAYCPSERHETCPITFAGKDFQNQSELVEYLRATYAVGVSGDVQPTACAQGLVSVTLHFLKTSNIDNPEEATNELFMKHLLQTTSQLKEKYGKAEVDENRTTGVDVVRLREFELQILLHFELESLLTGTGRTEEDFAPAVSQISSMLTRMTLLKDHAYMSTFLKNTLLEHYAETTPRLLVSIFEELLLPLPSSLAGLFSGSDEDESGTASVPPGSMRSDHGSVGRSNSITNNPGSNQPSRGRRSVAALPGLAAASNRQITIPVKAKETKEKKKVKRSERIASAKKTKQSGRPKSDVKQVRRNLFMGGMGANQGKMERHNSIAVMESTKRGLKTPNKRNPKPHQTTPKAHHVLKTKKVSETPAHKQVRQVMLRRLEKERQRAHTISEVDVVQESPGKGPIKALKTNLVRRASVGNLRRKSFYSDAPTMESRNVRKYEQLEARMTSAQPLMSPSHGGSDRPRLSPLKSPPRRIKPVNLFSSLSSPSPPKLIQSRPSAAAAATISTPAGPHLSSLGLDSPSKNTRMRSLFAPPELEPPVSRTLQMALRTSPRKRPSQAVEEMDSTRRIKPHSVTPLPPRPPVQGSSLMSPRKGDLLQQQFMSPTRKAAARDKSFLSPVKGISLDSFMSPVKGVSQGFLLSPGKRPSRGSFVSPPASASLLAHSPHKQQSLPGEFCTPTKSGKPLMAEHVAVTPDRPCYGLPPVEGFSTPRRSQRLACPMTPDLKPYHHSVEVTPKKLTPRRKLKSPDFTSTKSSSWTQEVSSKDGSQMLESWAQRAILGHAPDRVIPNLSTNSRSIDTLEDTIPVAELGLLSPPRKRGRNFYRKDSSETHMPGIQRMPSAEGVNVATKDVGSRPLRRSPRNSNNLTASSCQQDEEPADAVTLHGAAQSAFAGSALPVPLLDASGDVKGPPPCTLSQASDRSRQSAAVQLTPSRKFRAGRLTPEQTSPLDSWPRKKPRSGTSVSPGAPKLRGPVEPGEQMGDLSCGSAPPQQRLRRSQNRPWEIGKSQESSSRGSGPQKSLFTHDVDVYCQGAEPTKTSHGTPPNTAVVNQRKNYDSVSSTPGSKRKRCLQLDGDERDFVSVIEEEETPSKRRRTLRSRSTLSSLPGEDMCAERLGSPEVFVSTNSENSSTKENSPTYPGMGSSVVPTRAVPRYILPRGLSAGSDSGNSNMEMPGSPILTPRHRQLQRLRSAASSSAEEVHQQQEHQPPNSPVFCHADKSSAVAVTPSTRDGTPPSVKKFSPSISAMSLVHLMQSPLLETPDTPKNNTRRDARPKSSRRSLYRTATNLDGTP